MISFLKSIFCISIALSSFILRGQSLGISYSIIRDIQKTVTPILVEPKSILSTDKQLLLWGEYPITNKHIIQAH